MNRTIYLLSFLFLVPFLLYSQKPVKVTILGVHHFHNPGADMFNINQDDVKGPKRQKEVLDLVDRLMAFKPTKVVVETQYGSDRYTDSYNSYFANRDDDSLSRNETMQVGFRVAARMGHKMVHPFDFRKGMDLSELEKLAGTNPEVGKAFQEMMGEIGGFIQGINDTLKKMTMVEFLRYMNLQESVDLNHESYLRMLKMTGEDSYGAVSGVSDWYSRNIHMFYNLNRIADFSAEDERILIIVGQGHKKIIQDLIEDAPYYEYVDVLEFLGSN